MTKLTKTEFKAHLASLIAGTGLLEQRTDDALAKEYNPDIEEVDAELLNALIALKRARRSLERLADALNEDFSCTLFEHTIDDDDETIEDDDDDSSYGE
jgi:hypothetical protein